MSSNEHPLEAVITMRHQISWWIIKNVSPSFAGKESTVDGRQRGRKPNRAFYSQETEIYFMQEGTALARGRLTVPCLWRFFLPSDLPRFIEMDCTFYWESGYTVQVSRSGNVCFQARNYCHSIKILNHSNGGGAHKSRLSFGQCSTLFHGWFIPTNHEQLSSTGSVAEMGK